MSSINNIVLSGRVANPELRTFASGSSVLRFRLAVDQYTKGDGDSTFWIDVDVWNQKQAEALYKIVTKGMKVTVVGQLKYQEWENKNGEKQSKFSVNASSVDLPPKNSKAEEEQETESPYDIPF